MSSSTTPTPCTGPPATPPAGTAAQSSLHYLGDDVRYREREGAALEAGKSPALENGDLMDSAEFPVVWASGEGYLTWI